MEPLPETREALWRMSSTSEVDLVSLMETETDRLVAAVPGCIGMSVTLRDHELTFTWLATDPELRTLDAAQFLAGGPCEQAAHDGRSQMIPDLMDEEQWRLLAIAGAALGVRSTLSLPLRGEHGLMGSLNFYGRDATTFSGRERNIAEIFGADVQAAVMNADLSMSSRTRADQALDTLDAMDSTDIATGILAEREGIPVEEALNRLRDAAARAAIPVVAIAELVVRHRPT